MATKAYDPNELPDYRPMLPRALMVGDVVLLPEWIGPFPAVRGHKVTKIQKVRTNNATKYMLSFDDIRPAIVSPKDRMKVAVLCDNCHERPVTRTVTLGDTPTSLCQECFSGIEGVLEDEQGV